MTPPARRDGTPDKKDQPRRKDSDRLMSNAKPARRQNVSHEERRQAAEDHPLADAWWEDDKPADSPSAAAPTARVERLQKVLARAGVASRRHAEIMIDNGQVEVNGKIVRTQGVKVDPDVDIIRVDGTRVNVNENLDYFILNKPRGIVSTMSDDEGRPCVGDLVADRIASGNRLFHVGRLDADTEGLLLLTNDGELTNRLTHPSYEVPKTYLVQVRGPMEKGIGDIMKAGVELEDGVAKVDEFRLVDSVPGHILVEVVLHSGRNRIIRRLFDAVGYPVERLVRTQVGPIRIGDQKQGVVRDLSNTEVGHLLASVGLEG